MALRLSTYDIAQIKDREIFFDANILLYIFWPTGKNKWEANYSTSFHKLLKQGNTLITDFNTLSEFVNRAFRIELAKSKKYIEPKEYRNTQEGQDALNDIFTIIKDDIFKRFDIAAKRFFKPDIEKFLVVEKLDFNDKAIFSICQENNYVLITNDADFKFSDIDILSSNPVLLQ